MKDASTVASTPVPPIDAHAVRELLRGYSKEVRQEVKEALGECTAISELIDQSWIDKHTQELWHQPLHPLILDAMMNATAQLNAVESIAMHARLNHESDRKLGLFLRPPSVLQAQDIASELYLLAAIRLRGIEADFIPEGRERTPDISALFDNKPVSIEVWQPRGSSPMPKFRWWTLAAVLQSIPTSVSGDIHIMPALVSKELRTNDYAEIGAEWSRAAYEGACRAVNMGKSVEVSWQGELAVLVHRPRIGGGRGYLRLPGSAGSISPQMHIDAATIDAEREKWKQLRSRPGAKIVAAVSSSTRLDVALSILHEHSSICSRPTWRRERDVDAVLLYSWPQAARTITGSLVISEDSSHEEPLTRLAEAMEWNLA